MRASKAFLAVILPGALLVLPAAAQERDRERAQLQRLQQQLSVLQREKAGLQSEKAQLEEKLKGAEASAEELKSRAAGAAGRAAQLQKELEVSRKGADGEKQAREAVEKRLADLQRRFDELTARQQETAAALAGRDGEAKALGARLAAEQQRYATCGAANARLYLIGRDLLERYENKSCGAILLESEPFTRLKRVELENLVEDYRDRLDEQRVAPKPPAGPR
jgi:chromosome segregation ATPase